MKFEKLIIPFATIMAMGITYYIYTKVEEHKLNKNQIVKAPIKKETIKPKIKEEKKTIKNEVKKENEALEKRLLNDKKIITHNETKPVILGKQCRPMTKEEYLDTLRHKPQSKLIIHGEDTKNSFTTIK